MNSLKTNRVMLSLLATLTLPGMAAAQLFTYNQYGDLMVGFRKTGINAGSYEMVVNLGSVTNYLKMSAGTTANISNFSAAQLTDAFPGGFGNLQWSAFAAFPGSLNPWVTPLGSFPKNTLWVTLPSADANTQTTAPVKSSSASQQPNKNLIIGVGTGAAAISQNLAADADNTSVSVREPVSYNNFILSAFISDNLDPTIGDFGASQAPLPYVVENVTPGSFTVAQRCDLYQMCPSGLVDPITGQSSGSGYFVGYFILKTDGTMTFTRAGGSTPPPAPTLTIGRNGNVSTISLSSVSGANYTLYYNTVSGLLTPVSTWMTGGSQPGNGGTLTFQDTSTDSSRIYSVKAQ